MRTRIFRLLLLLLGLLSMTAYCLAFEELLIDDFASGLSPHWRTKSFVGKTEYTTVAVDGRRALRAESRASASGLVFEKRIDPKNLPILSWSWKIDSVLPSGDAMTKEGDDFAARIYVVFPSFFFWRTKAVNYIWANKLPKDTQICSSYTDNSCLIAVESGNELAGHWLGEKRNIYEDYKNCFGEEPPMVGAIAIMTDSDDTGGTAVAYYGPIRLRAVRQQGK